MKKDEKIVIAYNDNGDSIFEDDKDIVYAKYRNGGNLSIYECLVDKQGHLYNFSENPAITARNISNFKFIPVNEECFSLYLSYLKKRHEAHWRKADVLVANNS